mmetsp:Transcript_92557/g.145277  ORF Transcript_92557/g.145277 Transcript_92557/m.145277 type:complete len:202 (-) Transcript_92557:88-693(-)
MDPAYDQTYASSPYLVGAGDAQAHMLGLLHWLRDESFVFSVAEWSWDWCMEFPRQASASSMEHSLRWTEAHKEYRIIFENRAHLYLQFQGLEIENFLHMAVNFLENNPREITSDIFEGLVASEDYLAFFAYMSTIRRRREWAERTLCSASDELDWTQLVRRALMRDLGDVSDFGDGFVIDPWQAGCLPELRQPYQPAEELE